MSIIKSADNYTRLKWSPTDAARYAGVRIQRYNQLKGDWESVAEYPSNDDPGFYEMDQHTVYRVVSLWYATNTGDTVTITGAQPDFIEIVEPGIYKQKQKVEDLRGKRDQILIEDTVIGGYHPVDAWQGGDITRNFQVFTVILKSAQSGTTADVYAGNQSIAENNSMTKFTGYPTIQQSGAPTEAVGGNLVSSYSSTIERIEGISLDTINLGY